MRRICIVLFFGSAVLAPNAALAKPEFLDALLKTYSAKQGSMLRTAGCKVCHGNVPKRNAFGEAVEAAFEKGNEDTLTAMALHETEQIDSDGDGFSNGEELNAGTLPADAASQPEGKPADATAQGSASNDESMPGNDRSGSSSETSASPLVPTHSFHPALVHFPIALFLFAVILDLVGWRKKNSDFYIVARWNMLGAAVLGLASLVSGIVAWQRMGMKLEGNLQVHLVLAIVSCLLMFGVAKLSFNRKNERSLDYWLWSIAAALAVGFTGHFGALMVHG